MRKFYGVCAVIVCLVLILSACGQNSVKTADASALWQEQYDLGVRYLEEGNYEEAIIAFSAAIEIDPKQAVAYVGRGDAYIFSGETEENLAAAQADYEKAIELGETNVDAYLGLADVYIRQGEYNKALEILQVGMEKTGNQTIADKIAEVKSGTYIDSSSHVRRADDYDMDGRLTSYTVYEYDDLGRRCSWTNYNQAYNEDGPVGEISMENRCEVKFDIENRPIQYLFYDPDGTVANYDAFVYDNQGHKIEQYRYDADGTLECYFYFYYDESGRETKYEGYNADGEMTSYWIDEYDEAGNFVGRTQFNPDGAQIGYTTYS